MAEAIWHLNDSWWDTALPKYILSGAGVTKHTVGIENVTPSDDVGVLLIPGRHSTDHYDSLNKCAAKFKKVIFLLSNDEEGIFHADRLEHPRMVRWWLMPPFHPKQKVDRVGPNGWPTDAPYLISLAKQYSFGERPYDWSFMGQMTHIRRLQCVDATQGLKNGRLVVTQGFTQGESRENYYAAMVRSKIVLCPSGPCTPDSFRFAESLEANCIPVVDQLTQHADYPPGYWRYVFNCEQFPFPVISSWSELPDIVDEWLEDWETKTLKCQIWWTAQKERMIAEMKEDLRG